MFHSTQGTQLGAVDMTSKSRDVRVELDARRAATASIDAIDQQRARTAWANTQARADGANPTYDGLIAGTRSGALHALVGLAAVSAATVGSPTFRAATSPGARAWIVCIVGMAGFFINSEMAVVGSDARDKAAAQR